MGEVGFKWVGLWLASGEMEHYQFVRHGFHLGRSGESCLPQMAQFFPMNCIALSLPSEFLDEVLLVNSVSRVWSHEITPQKMLTIKHYHQYTEDLLLFVGEAGFGVSSKNGLVSGEFGGGVVMVGDDTARGRFGTEGSGPLGGGEIEGCGGGVIGDGVEGPAEEGLCGGGGLVGGVTMGVGLVGVAVGLSSGNCGSGLTSVCV